VSDSTNKPTVAELKAAGPYCILCGSKTHKTDFEGVMHSQCPLCNWVDWESPMFVAVSVVEGKRTDKRTIVLVQRANGKWCLPAGFLNTGEHPSDAAKRETKEEGGMTITVGEIPVRILTPPGKNQNLIFYCAETSDGVLQHGSDAKDVKEFAADELPEIAFPLHVTVINQFFAGDFDKK
jgi:ADP-ribose pyrophosphatase YjhB (NUDIX family)